MEQPATVARQYAVCLILPEDLPMAVDAVGEEYHLDHLSSEGLQAWENGVRLAADSLTRTAFPLAQRHKPGRG